MSDYLPSSDWSWAAETSRGCNMKLGTAPSDILLQSPCSSSEAHPHLLSHSSCLDDLTCQSPALTPPLKNHSSSEPGGNRLYRNPLTPTSPLSCDWASPYSPAWGCRREPELRECVSCRTSTAPLWTRDDAGQHLCNTCSFQVHRQVHDDAPLLRAKRKTTSTKRGRCVNCETETTTLWRRNAAGERVCNACGLYYRLHQVQRPLILKKEGIQTRNRKVINKKKRAGQSQSSLSSLAPPTEEPTYSSFRQLSSLSSSSSSSSSSHSLQLCPFW
ncbi:trans-acting T-cell-specific transcription factor GATA-3 [Cololabis saira]|uniref:trans-acting T-cell-specific transcription factor GATA-3 n=1 Tax=Cololabis saira TaxID=129043 RepID=UPI002AD3237F|nr:trans-acting T-cell-specific transcription factor GATA-3 [Cololabis saira]